MDIYFCDLCGVRVTDVDLKGGHGLRRSHDVICATCLELGHGKDWLAKHSSQPRAAAKSAAPAQPAKQQLAMVAAASSRPAALLDVARDRARTADDDHTPAVAPQVLTADEDPVENDGVSELDGDGDHEITEAVGGAAKHTDHTNLAAAANSFSALGAASGTAVGEGDSARADDLEDGAEAPAEDEAGDAVEAHGEATQLDADSQIEQASSPFAFKQTDETEASPVLVDDSETSAGEEATTAPPRSKGKARRSGGKDETQPSERAALKNDGEGVKKSSSGSNSANRRSSVKNSTGKAAKSGKLSGRSRAKANNKMVMIITCVTLPLLFLLMAYLQFSSHKSSGPRKTETVNISEEVKKGIVAAKLDVTVALNASPKKLEQLDSARSKIQAIIPLITNYETVAKSKGMSDDDIQRALEMAHWNDLQGLIKSVNDERAKLLMNR